MQVCLVSIGHGPSLALRNLERFAAARASLREVSISRHDFDLRDFHQAQSQSAQQWSWASRIDEAVAELLRVQPRLVGFSCYLWNTDFSLHLARLLKRLDDSVSTVFGGPDAGPRAETLLADTAVDFVVEGDGEIPFAVLLEELLEASPDYSRVPSLRYRTADQLVISPPPAEPLDLSTLAGVYQDLPPDIHSWAWPHLLYETLRGCPYRCSYCMYGKTPMNAKPVDLAVDELAALLDRDLVVEIIDPTFTTYKKRAKEILRRLGELNYSGGLYLEAYPDSIDEEMAELMSGARVRAVGIGLQTVSAEGLRAVRRPRHLERFERALELLRTQQIGFYVDVIYGLPGTKRQDFFDTIDYLYALAGELGDFGLVIYRLLGLPGSPMMDDAEKHGLVFSPTPPYELLRSDGFSFDDVLFCERFRHAFDDFTARFSRDQVERMSQGGRRVSELVALWMEVEADPVTFDDRVEAFGRGRPEPADQPAALAVGTSE